MRYHRDAPPSAMEASFVHLMKWGHGTGVSTVCTGNAPLSSLEDSPAASLWNRLGTFLYEHGEAIYNFQGLRATKRSSVHPGSRTTWRIPAASAAARHG